MTGTSSAFTSRCSILTRLTAGMLLVLLAGAAHGAGPPPRRTDLYGDPLPPGAVARLGTMRLRHAHADITFSRDGKQLISCGWDGVVRFWDTASGRLVRSQRLAWKPQKPWHYLEGVTLSPGGTLVAAVDEYRPGVYLFDTATGRERRRPRDMPGGTFLFSADGKVLAVGTGRRSVRFYAELWDIADGKLRRVVKHKGDTTAVTWTIALAPDARRLAAVTMCEADSVDGPPGDVRLWDAATGREIGRKAGALGTGECVAFSPDGKTLAVGFDKVHLLDTATLKEKAVLPSTGGSINALGFSPDGRFLAGVSGAEHFSPPLDGKSVLLWDLKGPKKPRQLPGAGVHGRFAFTPNGKTFACPSSWSGSEIRVWDVPTGRQLLRRPGHGRAVEALAVSPDGKLVASDAEDGLYLWNASTGAPLHELGRRSCEKRACLFSPDGRRLVSAGPEGTLQAWDVAEGKELRRFNLNTGPDQHVEVQAFGLSADGKRLAAVFSVTVKDVPSGQLLVWDLATGKRLRRRPYSLEVRSIDDRGDARLAPAAGFVALFDPPPRLPRVTGHAAFAPGAEVVTTWLGTRVGLEDVSTRRLLAALPKGVGQPLVFSPDGRLVAAALLRPKYEDIPYYGDERTAVCLIEAATGEEIVRLKVGDFGGVAFTPDGRALVVANRRGLRVWDADTGERLHRRAWPEGMRDHRGEVVVRSLAVLPGGRAVTGAEAGESSSGTWPPRPGRPASRRASRAARNWTPCGPTSPATPARPTAPCTPWRRRRRRPCPCCATACGPQRPSTSNASRNGWPTSTTRSSECGRPPPVTWPNCATASSRSSARRCGADLPRKHAGGWRPSWPARPGCRRRRGGRCGRSPRWSASARPRRGACWRSWPEAPTPARHARRKRPCNA
jgi:WD40 repeat protein